MLLKRIALTEAERKVLSDFIQRLLGPKIEPMESRISFHINLHSDWSVGAHPVIDIRIAGK
jgi:hypothetical protein